jgi:hypothetical protein
MSALSADIPQPVLTFAPTGIFQHLFARIPVPGAAPSLTELVLSGPGDNWQGPHAVTSVLRRRIGPLRNPTLRKEREA